MLAGELNLQDRITDQVTEFDAHSFFVTCKAIGLEPIVWQVGEQPIKISLGAIPLDKDSDLVFRRVINTANDQDPDCVARRHYALTKWLQRLPGVAFIPLG